MKFKATIKKDQGRGKELGFPTANFDLDQEVEDGIYVGTANDQPCLIFVGANVTFGEERRHGEVYILDYNGDLYGQEMEITIAQKLRDVVKFESPEDLVVQMKKDEQAARDYFQKNSAGFTLMELLVVIAVIGLLGAIVTVSLNSARDKSRAARMAADFSAIKNAWAVWQLDTNSPFLFEDIYGLVNVEEPCNDEPVLSATDMFVNVSGTAGWHGPYLSAAPTDALGHQYSYDNDSDVWGAGNKWGGVNIQVQWCNATDGNRYLQLAPLVDKIYDNGDGADLGRFRWDTDPNAGGFGILLAPSSLQ